MSERHSVLILEDNPENAAALRDVVGAMDFGARVVDTLEELRALLATGFRPCAALLDMQVPYAAGARPHEKAGESAIAMLKTRWTGAARVPIVVVTAFRSDPEYVWAMAELEVDGFCAKTNIGALPDKLTHALRKAGRGDHAECAARERDEGEAEKREDRGDAAASTTRTKTRTEEAVEPEPRVTLAMLGDPVGRSLTSVRVCGELRKMGDARFAILLRAAEIHERDPEEWGDRFDLGLGEDRGLTTHVRAPFRGLVPKGFQAFEGDNRKRFRLNPKIVLEKIDWTKLAKHPDPAIRKIAERALQRRGR